MACLLFLDLATVTVAPWWVTAGFLLLWVVLFATATRWFVPRPGLVPLLPLIARVGGSKAQHEVVEETLLHALISGDDHDRAARLLSARLERRASPLDRRRLATVGGASQPLEAALR